MSVRVVRINVAPTVRTVAIDGAAVVSAVLITSTGPSAGSVSQVRVGGVAGHTLSGHRLVTRRPNGEFEYASNDEPVHLHAPVWLTLGAVMDGEQGEVLAYGAVTESSWSWTPGPIYLGADGLLTQTPPSAPAALFLAQVGAAMTPTSVFIDRHSSITLL